MKSFVRRALFVCSLLCLGATAAYSCTCLQISHRKEFRQSDVIFSGQVISITEDRSYRPPKLQVSPIIQKRIDSTKRYLVNFKVERKFKGQAGKEIPLTSYESDGPCSGMTFTKGERYLIYADRKEGRLEDGGLCSRTRKLDSSSKEFRDLNSFWFRFKSRLPLPS
jgi:hypothetical protein